MDVIIKEEIDFSKGNISEVFKENDIVYRKLKKESRTIHRLLKHLEKKNIDFTPEFLGIEEEKGLEKLSFVDGVTLENYPIKTDIKLNSEIIKIAAGMLRKYHDATLDFKVNEDDVWFLEYKGNLDLEVICHNDFAPYNVTFKNEKPYGIIDFDTACPAPRVWDVAYALYRFIPLGEYIYNSNKNIYRKYNKILDAPERKELIKIFMESYGVDDTDFVLKNLILRLGDLVDLFDIECSKGNEAFIKMKKEGHKDFYIKEIEFIKENMKDWI